MLTPLVLIGPAHCYGFTGVSSDRLEGLRLSGDG
jgi:hypothetical protein